MPLAAEVVGQTGDNGQHEQRGGPEAVALGGVSMKGASSESKLLLVHILPRVYLDSTCQHANFVIQALTADVWSYHDIRHDSTNPTLSHHFNLQKILALFPGLYEPLYSSGIKGLRIVHSWPC